jgi:flagellar basal-body rod protein FlgB
MTSTPIIQLLEKYLSVTTERHQMIVSNMANIDTPGYRTRDIDFQAEMQRVSDENGMSLFSAVAANVAGLPERPDGNNVDLEREGIKLSETQMRYQIGVQLVKSEFHRLLSAINEGR